MSNCETFNLPIMEIEPHQLREVLRCVIHTILFNRALGYVKPREVDSDLFDITYVHCGDDEVDRQVEARIGEVVSALDKRATDGAQVCLGFYERRQRQAWFGTKDERLYWEQWFLNFAFIRAAEAGGAQLAQGPGPQQVALQQALEGVLRAVTQCVNDKKDHIPPVVSKSTLTFPFDIVLQGSSKPSFSLHSVKKMLMQTSPPPMLS